jgi:pimeloyl-ACP methyl ester carboxylesterase
MLLLGISVHAQQQPTAKSSDSVSVAPGVQLETKDWGGSGRTVVLLAGLGGTLHAYDAFAPRLTSKFHVIGLTRRGYGTSSHPDPVGENYDADRYQSVPLSIR